jgi:cytochrome P450
MWKGPLDFLLSLPIHGDLVEIRLGTSPAYVVCHPELVHSLLRDSRTFDKGGALYQKARQVVGYGLTTCAHESHARQRRLLQPAFARSKIVDYADTMTEQIAETMRDWNDGQVVALNEELCHTSIRIIAHTMFTAKIGADAVEELRRSSVTLLDGIFRNGLMPFELIEKIPTSFNRRFRQASTRLDVAIHEVISAYRCNRVDNGDMLSELLATRDENGDSLTDQEIHDQVLTFILAGTETTANLIAWTLYQLGQHPQIQQQLHTEIDAALGGRSPRYDDISKLELTGRVLSEVLRLYPPGWILGREVTARTKLAGHVLNPGDVVFYSPYILHRRADLYPDPDRFDPDRWKSERHLPPGANIPFGLGKRKCIGDVFGRVESTLVVAAILARWKLEPLPGYRVRPQARIALRPSALSMRVFKRPSLAVSY